MSKPCPCCSNKEFAHCCEPFLRMQQNPKSARALVRARFCAYALGAGTHREFLLRTWHPATASRVRITDLTNDNLRWTTLEIVYAEQQGEKAAVEFKAGFVDTNGQAHIHHERALFHRIGGSWLYLDGKVGDVAVGNPTVPN